MCPPRDTQGPAPETTTRIFCVHRAPACTVGPRTTLAADGGLTATRKAEISQLFHGFYDTSLISSTNSAAFQLALWEITFEKDGNPLNVDGASSNKGT